MKTGQTTTTPTDITQSFTVQQAVEQASIQADVFHSVRSSFTPSATSPQDAKVLNREVTHTTETELPVVATCATWAEWFWNLLAEFKDTSTDRELETLSHPHGILGRILAKKPVEGKELAAKRLDALQAAVEKASQGWWLTSSKTEAMTSLNQLRDLLNAGQHNEFLQQLAAFETKYGYGSFETILNGHFTGNELISQIDPVSPIKYSQLQEMVDANASDETQETNTDIAYDLLTNGEVPALWSLTSHDAALAEMIRTRPEVAKELLIDLLARKARTCKQNGSETFTQVATLLGKARDLDTSEVVAFIEQLNNPQLITELAVSATSVCVDAHHEAITSIDIRKLNEQGLAELKSKAGEFAKLDTEMLKDTTFGTEHLTEIKPLFNAIKVAQLLQADQKKPLSERVYMLRLPTITRLVEQLGSTGNSPEQQLYKAAENYQQRMIAYTIRPTAKARLAFQQARFDFNVAQEEALMAEAKAHLDNDQLEAVLSTGSYEGNRDLLIEMDKVLQRSTPVRPVASKKSAYYQLGANKVWKNRPTVQQRLADLQHKKDLKECGYSFTTQLGAFASSNVKRLPAAADAAGQVVAAILKAPQSLKALKNAEISVWSILSTSAQATSALNAKTRAVLESTLKVAERNPVLFRRMAGDFAQSGQQLLSVFGLADSGLISTLQTRLQAEATASVFAGDMPVIEELSPEDIEIMKNFQFLCDLGKAAFVATTTVAAAQNFASNTLASRTGYVVGGLTGAVVGGMAGAAAGAHIGNYAGAAIGTAFKVGSAVATREVVNHMEGKTLRAVNKLANYGPLAPFSTSGWEQLGQFSRSVAQKQSYAQAAANSILAPVTYRLTRLSSAISGVINREAGAGWNLASETFKCVLIAGGAAASASVVGGIMFHTGILTIAMSPFIGSALGTLATAMISSYAFCTFVNRMECGIEGISAALTELNQLLIPAGSMQERDVEATCRTEAEKMAKALASNNVYQNFLNEELAKEIGTRFWDNFSTSADQELVKEITESLENELAETEQERLEIAEDLSKMAQAMELLKKYQDKVEELQDMETFTAFSDQLKKLDIECLPNRDRVQYFMRDQMLQLSKTMERLAGTDELDTDLVSIQQHLSTRHLNILKGDYLQRVVKVSQQALADIEIDRSKLNLPEAKELADAELDVKTRTHETLVARETEARKESLQLAVAGVAKRLWHGKTQGNLANVSKEALAAAYNQEKQLVQDTQMARKQQYQAQWEKLDIPVDVRKQFSTTAAASA
ncbi:hypothetical protein EOPP23_19985 [Endozoicomonas sp. OPT23]|uniref:hypothetical protein n=1 Tax=Endozoicomonas sp. OPT23 TaxID=2072845 RepID=UPI00129A2C63|nr:hypothetical protein [Endozoicomonas sp. OPT23]MRI35253.1 hypothetical protein [Endozoicomonas sp. OPT23]